MALSCREASAFRTTLGAPPPSATRLMKGCEAAPKRIECWLPQEPDGKSTRASQRVIGGPPDESIFLSFPSEKNAMKRLSGDQKGAAAPSVPGSVTADGSASDRTHRKSRPSALRATKARRRPSGETANRLCCGIHANRVPTGARTANRMGAAGGLDGRRSANSAVNAAAARMPAAARPNSHRGAEESLLAGAGGWSVPPLAIHASWRPTSAALCQRWSGSLAKQVPMTRSSAGGDIGRICETGFGSSRRITEMRDARVDPENAFLPVAIS